MLRSLNRRQFLKFYAGASAVTTVAEAAAFALKKPSSAFSAASLVGYWKLNEGTGATGSITLDTSNPVNTVALTTGLKLQIV